ncbi:MAG: hypothetical protein EZS28_041953, partial [Streblomastix strix]
MLSLFALEGMTDDDCSVWSNIPITPLKRDKLQSIDAQNTYTSKQSNEDLPILRRSLSRGSIIRPASRSTITVNPEAETNSRRLPRLPSFNSQPQLQHQNRQNSSQKK